MTDSVEIYYFSGTGNSLYVARELQKRIPGAKLIPIVSLLDKDVIETDAETVGFVFPLHGMTTPIPVKKFLTRADFKTARYLFAAVTRAGTKCLAFNKINKILKGRGKALDACFTLTMASNDPKFEDYEIPSKEKIAGIDTKVQEQLDFMGRMINNREKCLEADRDFVDAGFLLERLVLLGMKYAGYDGARNYFYADTRCTGCGLCEKVCLSRKIKMVDKKPVWQNDRKCYLCYACINFCPQQAAQIKTKWYMKSYTDRNGRYPHPYATANDIVGQKCSRPAGKET